MNANQLIQYATNAQINMILQWKDVQTKKKLSSNCLARFDLIELVQNPSKSMACYIKRDYIHYLALKDIETASTLHQVVLFK